MEMVTRYSVYFQLTPVEKYAMKFLESSDDGWAAEAERMAAEIEQQKKEWELGRLQALKEEEERMAHNSDEDLITYPSVDAHNQVNIKKKKGKGRSQTQATDTRKGRAGGRVRKGKYESSSSESEEESDDESEDEQMSDLCDTSSSEEVYSFAQKKLRTGRVSGENKTNPEGMSNSHSKSPKVLFSKVSEDSPRTRSRGRVKINLWTLDVNPVLPGERPVPFSRKQLASFRGQGITIPNCDGPESPCLSDDKSGASDQTLNGDYGLDGEGEGARDGEGEDIDVDVVGDSGDSSNVDGTQVEGEIINDLDDVTGTLKSSGPTQITLQNGVGL